MCQEQSMIFTDLKSPISSKKRSDLTLFKGNERILVVDDEPLLVKAHKMQLSFLGYRVIATTNSEEALQTIQTDPHGFDLLITDQIMPGFTGVELAAAVQEINPRLPIILCTGEGDILLQKDALSVGICDYVSKPIFGEELFQAIRKVLDENKKNND